MSDKSPVLFFHGKESKPWGTKSLHLRDTFEVEAPDFQDMDIWERLEKAEIITEGREDLVVVGSSYGGLLAALLYSRHPERFRGYVLLAPALYLPAADAIDRMPENAAVIQGTGDEVVPPEAVRRFCADYDVDVIMVDDNHRLHASLDKMVEALRGVVDDSTPRQDSDSALAGS